jgi:hypothetical protein
MYSPPYSQVHAATGRYTECLSERPLSDYVGHFVLRCFFCSYGTVQKLLHVVTLQDTDC